MKNEKSHATHVHLYQDATLHTTEKHAKLNNNNNNNNNKAICKVLRRNHL